MRHLKYLGVGLGTLVCFCALALGALYGIGLVCQHPMILVPIIILVIAYTIGRDLCRNGYL
jgi:hypothetical protein